MEVLIFLVFAWAFLGFIGVLIAQSKNLDPMEGATWGCLLGPIGWLVLAMKPGKAGQPEGAGRRQRKCPFCAEYILAEAKLCKHCRKEVPPVEDDAELVRDPSTVCAECRQPLEASDSVRVVQGARYHESCAKRRFAPGYRAGRLYF